MKTGIARFAAARGVTFGLGVTALMASIVLSAGAQSAAPKPAVDKSARVGDGVYEVVAGADAVYVATTGRRGGPDAKPEAKVVALDPKTLEIKKAIDVSSAPAFGLGLNEKTQMLYTSNTRNGTVSAIDLKTGTIAATIKSDDDPKAHTFRVLPDEANNKVYVSLASKDGKIWVIDGKTNTIAHTITGLVSPTGLALDPAGNRLYAALMGSNEIAAVDLKTNEVVARYPAGGERPTQLAFDAKTNRLFITNQTSGDMTVLDTRAGTIVKTLKTGAQALGIGFNPNTNRIYVANRQAGTVSVIDAATYELVADLPAGSLPNTVAIDRRTNVAYVTNKAKRGGRGAPPVDDPNGDTVTMIR
jgi:YVTN family beta-propeller protein